MPLTNSIVDGLSAYRKDIGSKAYEEGYDAIDWGNKKKANNKDNKKRKEENA